MVPFVIGVIVGSFASVCIIGFMIVLADEQEKEDMKRAEAEKARREFQELKDHYSDYY